MSLPGNENEPEREPEPCAGAAARRAREHRGQALRALDNGDAALAIAHALLAIEARLTDQIHELGDVTEAIRHSARYLG